MSRKASVRVGVPGVHGGGAEGGTFSAREAEPPSVSPVATPLPRNLTDEQLMGLALFFAVHEGCGDLQVIPTWDESLLVLLEVSCRCPECVEARTYHRDSGSPEGGDTPA